MNKAEEMHQKLMQRRIDELEKEKVELLEQIKKLTPLEPEVENPEETDPIVVLE